MKRILSAAIVFLAASLSAQVQIGRNVQIGGASGGGTGTVTSVSTAGYPSPFGTVVITFSTTTPLITFTAPTYSQNQFLAGPTSGSGNPTARAIVPGDIPTLNQNTTGTASNLSGTPALPNGTTATTQSPGDNTTKLATDAFVLANAGSGAVSSVSNSDSSLTVTPTTGAVVASINPAHANTWTAPQTFAGSGPPISIPANKPCSPSAGTGQICTDANGDVLLSNNAAAASAIVTQDSGVTSCPKQDAYNICLIEAPYYASGQADTTTTAASITSGSTSAVVGSCSTFNAHNGFSIPGAAAAGAEFVDRATSCTSSTLHWTTPTSTSVTSVTIYHNDLPAFQDARDAINGLTVPIGTIWLPAQINGAAANYAIDGPLQNTSGSNAVFPMPVKPNYTDTTTDIEIKGYNLPNWDSGSAAAVISTRFTTGNLIAGYDSATGGGWPPFTNVKLGVSDITFSGPCNTGGVFMNATHLQAAQASHVLIRTPCPTSFTTGSGGIWMPGIGNEVQNYLTDTQIAGVDINYKLTEHTVGIGIHAEYGGNCFVFDNGTTGTFIGGYTGNGAEIVEAWEQNCVNVIVGGAGTGGIHNPVHISLMNMENTTGNGILDPNNTLYGIMNVLIPGNTGGSTTACNANISEGASPHYTLHYISCQPESAAGSSPPNNGLIENLLSQEGQGAVLVNSGYDFSNSMTASNVTWASASGFTGTVATYNGTSSTAIAGSATNTAFDGSTPFSSCAWTVPGAFTGISDQYLMDNLTTAVGWGMEVWGTGIGGFAGAVNIQLYATGSNYITAHTAAGVVTASALNHVCFTYNGNQDVSGFVVYVNGVSQALTSTHNNFSGSAATAVPLQIGTNGGVSFYLGAIGYVQVFNRLLSQSEITTLFQRGPHPY